jgi:protein phosphatase
MLVADGVGGAAGGECASRIVAEELVASLSGALPVPILESAAATPPEVIEDHVRAAIAHSQAVVERCGVEVPGFDQMGTTLTLAYFTSDHMIVGHLGDSRCYLLRSGKLRQLTRDHTLLQAKIDAGLLRDDGRRTGSAADRRTLTRAIAAGLTDVAPDVFAVELEPLDVILLCSDGLTDEVDDAEIHEILAAGWTPEASGRLLVAAANRAGGADNVTCVVARCRPGGSGPTNSRATQVRLRRWVLGAPG